MLNEITLLFRMDFANFMDEVFICAFCFEPNSIFVDPSGGLAQTYVEDCQVCCQPNRLGITWDDSEEKYLVESQPES